MSMIYLFLFNVYSRYYWAYYNNIITLLATGFDNTNNVVGMSSLCVLWINALYRLTPGAVYYYKFGDSQYGWSDEYMFKTAPLIGSNGSVHVITYGGTNINLIWIPYVIDQTPGLLKISEPDNGGHRSREASIRRRLLLLCMLWSHD